LKELCYRMIRLVMRYIYMSIWWKMIKLVMTHIFISSVYFSV
jgi:hypothetical protein